LEIAKRTHEEVRAAFREYMREKREENEAAQGVVLVQVYVLLRPSACPNYQGLIGKKDGVLLLECPLFVFESKNCYCR
jgi:hypothetical protein